jgi:quercetin dioxygenase-like cupin family protein
MKVHDWSKIEKESLNPSLARQVVHTSQLTIARIHLSRGAVVPEHSHANEQVTTLLEGSIKFVYPGGEIALRPGETLEIPSNLPHRVEALEDSVALDVFAPRRDDWIRGDDAYLRR